MDPNSIVELRSLHLNFCPFIPFGEIYTYKFLKIINYSDTYLIRLQTEYPNFHANSTTLNNLLETMNCIDFLCLTIKVINKIDSWNNIIFILIINFIII